MKLIKIFSLLLMILIISCNNKSNFSNDISLSEKKIILSSIELKDSIYFFDEEKAKNNGLSDNLILKMNEEILKVNQDIEEAIKLPNSTIEFTDPKDLNIDSLLLKK